MYVDNFIFKSAKKSTTSAWLLHIFSPQLKTKKVSCVNLSRPWARPSEQQLKFTIAAVAGGVW